MAAAKPSDSSRNQAGIEVITRALPFETIPREPLRAHFARWLIDSLTGTARPGPVPETEHRPRARPSRRRQPKAERPAPPHAPPPADTPETAPPDDPLGSDPLPLEWQGPPAPPRPQFVRQRDGTVWVTKPILRSRGWTDAAVRDFLPEPEGLKPNPRFAATGAPMPGWRPATVAAAEAAPEWRAWLERSLRRRQTTLEALAETEDPDFRARVDAARSAIASEGGTPLGAPERR